MSLASDVLVTRAKSLFAELPLQFCWQEPAWEVSGWLRFRRTSQPRLWLRFSRFPSVSSRPHEPLPEPYQDVAKALLLRYWQRRRSSGLHLVRYLTAIRAVFSVAIDRQCQSPADLQVSDFTEVLANQCRRKVSAASLQGFEYVLRSLAAEMDDHAITAVPLQFEGSGRLGRVESREPSTADWLEARRDADKLPDMYALKSLSQCSAQPLDDDERILLRIIDLHLILGTRIGETLALPVDCWHEEMHSTGLRCGIRYFPEKGFDLAINWLAEQDVPIARRAVEELTALCKSARDAAAWQERNPGRLWQLHPTDLISLGDLQHHFVAKSAQNLREILRGRGIRVVGRRQSGDPITDIQYRVGDIENLFGFQSHRLSVITDEFGKTRLPLSRCLCVKYFRQFALHERFVVLLLPQLVMKHDIDRALGNAKGGSVFERRGIKILDDANSPKLLRIRTHAFRHYRNLLYDAGGMTLLQQTLAMGRKSATQTATYQHPTPAEASHLLRQLQQLQYQDKIPLVQAGIRAGTIQGPLTRTYRHLLQRSPVDAESFLQTFAGGAHVTPWGICTHDFALSPCQRYLQCFDSCRHYHRTMDSGETARLQALRSNMAASLDVMRKNAEGEAGADRWIQALERKLNNLDRVLEATGRGGCLGVPIPVFPHSDNLTAIGASDQEAT